MKDSAKGYLARSILVADSDTKFLDALKNDEQNRNYPVKITHNGKLAQLIIADHSVSLAGVFVSPSLKDNPNWASVLRCVSIHRPTTPVYMILDNREAAKELTDIDLQRLGVRESVEKPFSYKQMLKLIAPIALTFDASEALRLARVETTTAGENGFIPIRAEDFLSGAKSFFDVYVKLSTSGKYLKLLRAGDAFTLDRIASYLKNGVTHFYIRKEVQDVYVSYCDHITTALLKSETAPMDVKISQTLNQGEETMKHMENNGVTEENLRYAAQFVSNLKDLTGQLKARRTTLLSDFMDNVAAYEHGTGTAILAGLLANQMQIERGKPVQIVGMAALMHDIALSKMPRELSCEDESKMTPKQLRLFHSHPQAAADLLSRSGGFEPGALQAIEQHHMRIAGRGFPERTGTTLVTRVAEIIGICDELNRLLAITEKNPAQSATLFAELETHVFPFFGKAIVQAFKLTFFPRQCAQNEEWKAS